MAALRYQCVDAHPARSQLRASIKPIPTVAARTCENKYCPRLLLQHHPRGFCHRRGGQLHELILMRLLFQQSVLSGTNSGNGISRAHNPHPSARVGRWGTKRGCGPA